MECLESPMIGLKGVEKEVECSGDGYEVPRERLGRPQSRWRFSEKDLEGHGI